MMPTHGLFGTLGLFVRIPKNGSPIAQSFLLWVNLVPFKLHPIPSHGSCVKTITGRRLPQLTLMPSKQPGNFRQISETFDTAITPGEYPTTIKWLSKL
jgi:hypothetical protein